MAEARKIFFSYARKDSEFVIRLANDLRNEGQSIWVDQLDIPKGTRWDEEVETALKACPCLLVVLTPVSTNSQNVLDEVSYALGEKKAIIPILLRECSVPFRLRRLQHIDFTGDYDRAFLELGQALRRLQPPAEQPPGEQQSARRPAAGRAESSAEPEPDARASGGAAAATVESAGRRAASWKVLAPASLAIIAVLAGAYFALSGSDRAVDVRQPVRAPLAAIDSSRQEVSHTNPVVSNEAKPQSLAAPVVTPPPVPSELKSASQGITDAQAKEFVDRFLATANRGNPSDLLRLYDDRVDYFDRGVVGKDYILKDKQSYYRRWPEVVNRLLDDVVLGRTGRQDTATVSFNIAYQVRSPERGETKSGSAHNELQVRSVDGELKIVAERQRVVAK